MVNYTPLMPYAVCICNYNNITNSQFVPGSQIRLSHLVLHYFGAILWWQSRQQESFDAQEFIHNHSCIQRFVVVLPAGWVSILHCTFDFISSVGVTIFVPPTSQGLYWRVSHTIA